MKSIYGGFVRRALLLSIVILFGLYSFGAIYYLAPNGSDSNSGTISSPWFSLNKAWTVIKAGDIVYLRGGTYAFTTQQYLTGKNGTSGNLIQILAYPGENPVLTKSSSYKVNEGLHFCGNYFYWKGLEITGFTQIASGLCDGFRVENSSYNTFENLKVHGNGNGMQIANLGYDLHSTGNLVLNCDFYENQDPLTSDKYGNADGLAIEWITHPEDVNTIRGCRFWWNTDDGLDLYHNEGTVIIENCISFYNGYIPGTFTTAGDGNGFKLGDGITDQRNSLKRVLKNCISAKNRINGYTPNGLYGLIEMNNCTAYSNGNIGIHLADFNLANVAKNCLSFSNGTNTSLSTSGTYASNSWQNGITVTTADFKSLDNNLLLASRQSDGSLAENDYLKLVSTSKLIDKGINVGILYSGSAPDIGSYEYTASVVILPAVFNVTGGGSFCNGGSGVPVGLSDSESGVSYQLLLNGSNVGSAVAGTGSAISFGNKTTAGTYTVIAKNTSTSLTSTMSGNAVVTVNPLPTVSFTSGVSTCNTGSTGNVYATQSGMSNYKWTVSSGGTITSGGSSTSNAVTVTWNASGAQYVTVNYSNSSGCLAAQSVTYNVTVNASPSGYNVTGGGSYCSGGTGVPVGLSGSQAGVSYQLQLNGANDGSAVAGTGGAISFGNKTTAGTYTVIAKNTSTSLTSTMSGNAVVTVNPLPTVSFASGVSTCNAGSTGNVYTTQSGMSNYKWTVSSGGTITSGGSSTSNAVTITWNTSGAQYVTVNYSNSSGCSAVQSVTYNVTVNASPSGYNVTGGGSYCSGGTGVPVGLSGSQAGVSYQLQLNGANDGSAVAGTGSAITFGNKTTAGTYTVIAKNTSTSLTSTMSGNAVVTVNPLPTVTFASGVSTCNAGSTGNVYTTQSGMSNYKWTVSSGGTITSGGSSTSNAVTVTWNTAGSQTVLVNYSNSNGCSANTSSSYPVNVSAAASSGATAPATTTQKIQLKKGNNLISSYLVPSNIDAGVVVRPLISSGALVSMYDEVNKAIQYSSTSGWSNTIGAFKQTEGYLINVNLNCELQISGVPVTLPLDIPLKAGWNIISYPKTDAVNAMNVVQSLINQNKLVKVQDEAGNSLENLSSYGGWKNNIGNFLPGKAYKVYVSADAVLTIQSSYPKSASDPDAPELASHFSVSYDGNGLNHMNINLVGLNSYNSISAGDELAAFDGDLCVGAVKVSQDQVTSGTISLISSFVTNDQTLDGFLDGDSVKIVLWKKATGTESALAPEVLSGELKYAQNGSVLVELKNSLTTGVADLGGAFKVDVYPNPCNGHFSVRLSDLPASNSRIEIVDISGRVLLTRPITNTTEEFNLTNILTGIYFVRTINGSSQKTHKLIVNK